MSLEGRIVDVEHLSSAPPIRFNDDEYFDANTGSQIYDSAGKKLSNWWLSSTNTLQAWDYSIGTGVTVAFIDDGYKLDHPELKRRLIYGRNNFQENSGSIGYLGVNRSDKVYMGLPNLLTEVGLAGGWIPKNKDGIEISQYHGMYALLTGFAERDNKERSSTNSIDIKTVGVAPNAQIIPYAASYSWDFAAAIREARAQKVDVIGMNQAWKKVSWGGFFQGAVEAVVGTFTLGNYVGTQIQSALDDNIPVIVAGHNYYEPITDWTPVDKNNEWDIIVTGAVQAFDPAHPDAPLPSASPLPSSSPGASPTPTSLPTPTPNPAKLYNLAALFDPTITTDDPIKANGKGSNYGSDMVWAPGDRINVSYHEYKSSDPTNSRYYGGTSAATPFVTAVVALMKSRNPGLTPAQIKDILTHQAGCGSFPSLEGDLEFAWV